MARILNRLPAPPDDPARFGRLLRCVAYSHHYFFGLRVVAEVARRMYEKGLKASRTFLAGNPIQFDHFLPTLDYTAPQRAQLLCKSERYFALGYSVFRYSIRSATSSALSLLPATFSGAWEPVSNSASVSARPSCSNFTRWYRPRSDGVL